MSVRRVWGEYDVFFSKNVSYCGLLGPLESGGKKIVHPSAADIRKSRGNDCLDTVYLSKAFDVTAISSSLLNVTFSISIYIHVYITMICFEWFYITQTVTKTATAVVHVMPDIG